MKKKVNPELRCKHCKKLRGDHRAGSFQCPIGPKSRIGYLSYGSSVFEPMQKSKKEIEIKIAKRDPEKEMIRQLGTKKKADWSPFSSKGFTLMELMIAMFILCFALLAMASFMGTLFKATHQDKQTTVGITLVQGKLESLKNGGFVNAVTGNDTGSQAGLDFTRDWTVTTNGNMKQIDVSVTIGTRTVTGQTVIAQ